MAFNGIKSALGWGKKRAADGRAVILMYHRIVHLNHDPHNLAVAPDHFAQQLEVLKEEYQPISLLALAEAMVQREVPERAVVVTFDDGYLDNLCNARPLLDAAQIPATIFIVGDHISRPDEFWWDRLENILVRTEALPVKLRLPVGGQNHEWTLQTQDDRLEALKGINRLIRALPAQERTGILDELDAWAGEPARPRTENRAMTENELVEISQDGLITLGAHTQSHPVLSVLSSEEQRREILDSRKRVEVIVGKPVTTLSYPYGKFNEETLKIVRQAGFRAALSTRPGCIRSGDSLFKLPRCTVGDWDRTVFRQKMQAFFEA